MKTFIKLLIALLVALPVKHAMTEWAKGALPSNEYQGLFIVLIVIIGLYYGGKTLTEVFEE